MLIKIIRSLLFCLFIIFPFGQFTKVPGLPPTINLYLHDLIILSTLLLYLFTLTKKSPLLKNHPLIQPLLYFIFTAFTSLLFSLTKFPAYQVFISSLYLFRLLVYSSLTFILQDSRLNLPLKKLLLFSAGTLAIFGLIQYSFIPDTRFLSSNHWDDHYYRVIATFFDPSFVGIILALAIIMAFFIKASPWFYPLLLIPLFLTYSRSTYLALFSSLLSYAFYKKKLKVIFLGLLFLSILPFLPRPGGAGVKLERTFSINQRLNNYQDSLVIIKQHPVIGIGFNTLRFYTNQSLSHAGAGLDSSLLFILATTGLIGLLTFLYLIKNIYQHSLLLKISLIAILVHSLFQNSFFYPWVLIWLFTLIAMECN